MLFCPRPLLTRCCFNRVSLGATHGLILLPVILSMIGPEVHITLAADPQQSIKDVVVLDTNEVQKELPNVDGDDDEELTV